MLKGNHEGRNTARRKMNDWKKKKGGKRFSAVTFDNKNSSSINSRNTGLVMMEVLVFIYHLLEDVEFWLVCTLEEKLSANVVWKK